MFQNMLDDHIFTLDTPLGTFETPATSGNATVQNVVAMGSASITASTTTMAVPTGKSGLIALISTDIKQGKALLSFEATLHGTQSAYGSLTPFIMMHDSDTPVLKAYALPLENVDTKIYFPSCSNVITQPPAGASTTNSISCKGKVLVETTKTKPYRYYAVGFYSFNDNAQTLTSEASLSIRIHQNDEIFFQPMK